MPMYARIALAAALLIVGTRCHASSFHRTYRDATAPVSATLNRMPLHSGDKWALDFDGDRLINYALDDPALVPLTSGSPLVELTAAEARDVVSQTLNMTGLRAAEEAHIEGDAILLNGPPVAADGPPASSAETSIHWSRAKALFELPVMHKVIHPKMRPAQILAMSKQASPLMHFGPRPPR